MRVAREATPGQMSDTSDPAVQARFLKNLRAWGDPSTAAAACGFGKAAFVRRRESDEAFDAAWREIDEEHADALEAEVYRRAVKGSTKGIWYQGERVGEERVYSDSLAIEMLRAKRPDQFKPASKVDLSSTDGSMSPAAIGDTEIAARLASLLALAEARMASEGSEVAQ